MLIALLLAVLASAWLAPTSALAATHHARHNAAAAKLGRHVTKKRGHRHARPKPRKRVTAKAKATADTPRKRSTSVKPAPASKPASTASTAPVESSSAPTSSTSVSTVQSPEPTNSAPTSTQITTTPAPVLTGAPESSQWFSDTSVWRAALPDQTPVADDSSTLVSSLSNAVYNGGAPWINSSSYSTPVYTVPLGQPDVPVTLTEPNLALQQAFETVPLPTDAQPAAGADMHLVVWQPSTDTMWEFWKLQRTSAGGWTAGWGGVMNDVSSNPGYYTGADALWGATATSLPLLGGLITIDDLERGQIDHALAMAVPNTAYEEYTWPAQRTDGSDKAADAIPEGTRFRIPANVDLQSLNLPPVTLELAEAAQRYGIIVRDTAANVAFYAQDPTPTGTTSYAGFWGASQYPSTIMKAFPWSLLQVIDDGPVIHGW